MPAATTGARRLGCRSRRTDPGTSALISAATRAARLPLTLTDGPRSRSWANGRGAFLGAGPSGAGGPVALLIRVGRRYAADVLRTRDRLPIKAASGLAASEQAPDLLEQARPASG